MLESAVEKAEKKLSLILPNIDQQLKDEKKIGIPNFINFLSRILVEEV